MLNYLNIWYSRRSWQLIQSSHFPSQNWVGMSSPGGASDKEPACQCRRFKRRGFSLWVGKISWRRKWQPTPVFLPGKSHGERNLVGYRPQGCRVRHNWSGLACSTHGLSETEPNYYTGHLPIVNRECFFKSHLWEGEANKLLTILDSRKCLDSGK